MVFGFPSNSATKILLVVETSTLSSAFLDFLSKSRPTPPCDACASFLQPDDVTSVLVPMDLYSIGSS